MKNIEVMIPNSIENQRKISKILYTLDQKIELNNQINDISLLSNLINLENLNLNFNKISDVSVLSNLKKLKSLGLYSNQITNVDSLSNLDDLEWLILSKNPLNQTQVDELQRKLPEGIKIDFD